MYFEVGKGFYPWIYYSIVESRWFYKTCEDYSNTGDQFWKIVNPGIAFYEHEQSKKHSDAIRNKTEIKTILSKGNVLFQLQKGAENRTKYERKQTRELIKKKVIKTAYFLAKNNMVMKQSFEKFVEFISLELEEKLFPMHLSNAPKNAKYSTANSVEEYLKVLGEFLDEIF